jgi:hypothetical protein
VYSHQPAHRTEPKVNRGFSQGISRTKLFEKGLLSKTFVREIPWKLPFHGILTLIFIYKAIWSLIDGISRSFLKTAFFQGISRTMGRSFSTFIISFRPVIRGELLVIHIRADFIRISGFSNPDRQNY